MNTTQPTTTEATSTQSAVNAGWMVDPANHDQLRYWDGTNWTEHTAPASRPTETMSTTAAEVAESFRRVAVAAAAAGRHRPRAALAVAAAGLAALLTVGVIGSWVFGADGVAAADAMKVVTDQGLTCTPGGRTMSRQEVTVRLQGLPGDTGSAALDLVEDLPDTPLTMISCENDFDTKVGLLAYEADGELVAAIAMTTPRYAEELRGLGLAVLIDPSMA